MNRTQLNGPQQGGSFFGNIGCLLIGILVFYLFFKALPYLIVGAFALSPILFIAAYLINPKAVGSIVGQHFALFRYAPLKFLLRTVLVLLLFPFVSLGLLLIASGMAKAERFQRDMFGQMKDRMEQMQGNAREYSPDAPNVDEDGFTDFEELDSKPLDKRERE